jgi:predicted dienelactone hydrolase
MKAFLHIIVALTSVIAANAAGCASVPGVSVNIGTSTKPIVDDKRHRKLTAEIWFDAGAGADVSRFSARPPIRPIRIARNTMPHDLTTKKPLIVLSHGNWGTRYSQGWLAMTLVEAGYIVVSLSHPGTMADDRNDTGAVRLWDRARDASVVLDAVLADPKWAAIIDDTRIGFVGHSFGGFAGVSLAGGIFDPSAQVAFCKNNQHDMYCKGYAKLDTTKIAQQDAKESYKDARFKSFFLMAPGPAQGFSVESLRAISASVMVDAANIDTVLSTADNAERFAKTIPSAQLVLRRAGHFTYVPECKPVLGWLLASLICGDPDDVDRRAVHRAVAKDAVVFFARTLPPVENPPTASLQQATSVVTP